AGRQTAPAFPAACWQASLAPSHVSVVQALPSSVHAVPAGLLASAGQLGPVPGHISARSQSPADARQIVKPLRKPSAGQLVLVPVQFSAGSHSPPDGRQTVLGGSKTSAGQTVLVPVQFSSTSHGPAAARQTAPALPAGCCQASLLPSHSSRLHGLPSSV